MNTPPNAASYLSYALLVLSFCALCACRVSEFEDADVRRLVQESRQLRVAIDVDSDSLKSNFEDAQEALNRIQAEADAPPPTPDPLSTPSAPSKSQRTPSITPLLKAAMSQCFQEVAIDRSVPELTERLTNLSLQEHVFFLCNSDALHALAAKFPTVSDLQRTRALQHLKDVLLLRDLLKATIPQQVYSLGQDFLKARSLRARLNSRSESLPSELPPLDGSGETQLDNLMKDLKGEDRDLGESLKEVEQRLQTVVLILDETLETVAYEISSFGLPALP